mmetsp:Transcript_25756/g.12167  ORF Transcript_25756/g.12167 Transcript_25756/m.12167 type:complete len:85 (+) Transcript_25756:3-257(+)
MTWKSLMLIMNSEAPIVVVLSGSMEPAYQRGDILFLHLHDHIWPVKAGDVVVYKLEGKDIPIVHRVISTYQDGQLEMLTKGDNN